MKKILPLFISFCFIALMKPGTATAQKKPSHDSNYYETYPDRLTGRLYFSQKYVHLNFKGSGSVKELEYKANTNLNTGLGFSYHGFSLNVFYGFKSLNKDDAKGRTKGLDIQLHIYPRKWAVDLLAVFPKGFHIEPKGYASANTNSYYYRPDIKFSLLGLSAYRVPNKERFSYRAAILQTEWQKKSAGSVLYGGEIYSGTIKGDSALIPKLVQSNYPQKDITKISFLSIGPGIGYAYTLVMAQHFFISGSMIGNMNVNFTTETKSTGSAKKTALNPATVFKAAIGYNSSTWNVSANWTGNGIWFQGASSEKDYFWPTGNYRLVFAKKFVMKKHNGSK